MDVRNLPLNDFKASPFGPLNRLKHSGTSPAGAWGDVLNKAIEGRAGSAPADSINGAIQQFSQFAQRQTDLNVRLKASARTAKAFAARAEAEDATPSPPDQKLQETAQKLVNQFFMGTMLKQMRNSPFKNDALTGGQGGAAYSGLFDAQLSERAGNGMASGLVKSIVNAYRKHKPNSQADSGLAAPVAA